MAGKGIQCSMLRCTAPVISFRKPYLNDQSTQDDVAADTSFPHPAFMKCLHMEDKTIATPRHNIEILPTTKVLYTNVRLNTVYRTGPRNQVLCKRNITCMGS